MASKMKLQNAIEFLVTYSWAFTIILIVALVFLYLQIFNPYAHINYATPGSCYVYRPYGPFNNTDARLEGLCNDAPPEFVASINTSSTLGYALYTNNSALAYYGSGDKNRTFIAWIYVKAYEPDINSWWMIGGWYGTPVFVNGGEQALLILHGASCEPQADLYFQTWADDACSTQLLVPLDAWEMVGYVYPYNGNYTQVELILNNETQVLSISRPINVTYTSYPVFVIGGQYSNGYIANVQVYNTTLSNQEILALYKEGIGGAPIDLNNLIAWYPLNGNLNDTSGNNITLDEVQGTTSFVSYEATIH
ncbi:MAG: hypothetical protein ARM1_0263 [Candidatus Micrarchaeota archaeon]|nr:MAG: hypothetical protein ARM1_0263 [Candidatus Micrarchaeota archaeon]